MGKIYRIPRFEPTEYLKAEYRTNLAFWYLVACTICLGFGLSGISLSAIGCLLLLAFPVMVVLTIGLFQTSFPKLISGVLGAVSFLGALAALLLLIASISYLLGASEPPNCISTSSCDQFDDMAWERAQKVSGSLTSAIVELIPPSLTVGVFFYSLLSQIRVYRSEGTHTEKVREREHEEGQQLPPNE